jgi:hypothetical protein
MNHIQWTIREEDGTIAIHQDDIFFGALLHEDRMDEQRAYARLMAASPDLLVFAKQIMAWLEDGTLIRDIKQDGNPDWALKMMQFVQVMQHGKIAIFNAEKEE